MGLIFGFAFYTRQLYTCLAEMSASKIKWVKVEPYLYRNQISGKYYSRVTASQGGIRSGGFRALQTSTLTTARLRLRDHLRSFEHSKQQPTAPRKGVKMREVIEHYRRDEILECPELKASTRSHREVCLKRLLKTWKELPELMVRRISAEDCENWAKRLRTSGKAKPPPGSTRKGRPFSPSSVNKAIGSLRQLFEYAVKNNYVAVNPATTIARAKVAPAKDHVVLPSTENFAKLINEIQWPNGVPAPDVAVRLKESGLSQAEFAKTAGLSLATLKRQLQREREQSVAEGGWNKDGADFARFLAFTGMRLSEATAAKWSDIAWETNTIEVSGTKAESSNRIIPLIPEAKSLLQRMSRERGAADDRILRRKNITRALDGACKRAGIARLTHHDFRHFFATRCIESGVDIPTVARWLGHRDGGALATKTYGHLRDEHSHIAAEKVRFLT